MHVFNHGREIRGTMPKRTRKLTPVRQAASLKLPTTRWLADGIIFIAWDWHQRLQLGPVPGKKHSSGLASCHRLRTLKLCFETIMSIHEGTNKSLHTCLPCLVSFFSLPGLVDRMTSRIMRVGMSKLPQRVEPQGRVVS